jgi:hypothetical protein
VKELPVLKNNNITFITLSSIIVVSTMPEMIQQ